MMTILRFLLLEDKAPDAEAIQAILTDSGLEHELLRVETRADFVTALESKAFDLILAAYAMRGFDGIAALETAHHLCFETPFIFISASLGEELAIEALKQGATDYVLKQRLGRLVPCVERALREAQERRERQRAERMLIEQQQLLKRIASGQTLDDCLAAVCASVARLNPRVRSCFLLADAQRLKFSRSITPDFLPSFGQGIKDAPIEKLAIGTCGTAVYCGSPVTCADIAHDDRWAQEWRDLCLAHGILACHSVPVLSGENLPIGSLMLCLGEARTPTDWECQLAEFGAQVASIVFERDRTNRALRENEERLSLAISNAGMATWDVDMQTGKAIWSENHFTLLGYEPVPGGEASYEMWRSRVHPDDLETVMQAIEQAQQTRGLYSPDHRIIRANTGEICWLSVFGRFLYEDTGQAARFIGVFFDITNRKQAEAALRESEELKQSILKSSRDCIKVLTLNSEISYISPGGLCLLEIDDPTSIVNTAWANQWQGEDREKAKAAIAAATVGNTGQFQGYLPTAKGTPRWWDSIITPVRDADGQVVQLVAISRDITTARHTEVALRESESRFRLVVESAKDYAIITLDLAGVVTGWNAGAERVLGYSEAEIIGRSGCVIFTSEDIEQGHCEWELHLASTQGQAEDERWHIRKDGSRFWGSGLMMPLQDEAGTTQGFVKIMQDKTVQRQSEAEREHLLQREQVARTEAERANQLKDEFLAVLSHELRSPLNPILGWTRLLQTGKLDPNRQTEALKTIERNAKLQTQLIEDLLDISRIMQGKLSLTAAPVSLTFVITAAVETVQLAAEAKHIQILLDLTRAIPPVSGDAARLQQVVWNLLTNAVKFTPNGGQVTVELRQLDQFAQIRVIDTGKGIQSQFLPHVFEYFRQEDSSTTRKFGGLGLGLAIVRQIVELHSGTVRVESQGENQGAIFTVELPVVQQASPTTVEPDAIRVTLENPLSNLQILVVDDDNDTREFQAFVLEQSGAAVTAVASGVEALQALDRFIPDVLVSDVGMAEMDGYRLIQQIRSREASRSDLRPLDQGGQIPAIALTAYAAEVDQQRAIQAGFQTHMTKPVEPEELVKVIISLLGHT
jgi:PAS domain S-box-containing protein